MVAEAAGAAPSARAADGARSERSAARSSRARRLLPALYAAPSAAVLLASERLPFTDLPEHVAAARVIRDILVGDPTASALFRPNIVHSQYWLYHLAVALIAIITGPSIANTLVLLAAACAYPLSLAALLRAYGRDERLALFGAMPFLSRSLAVGFLPFVAAVPVAVFGIAALERYVTAPSRRRAIGLAALAVVLFYLHVDAFALFVTTCTLRVALACASAGGVARFFRDSARRLAFLVPGALVAAHWALRGSLAHKAETMGRVMGTMSPTRTALAIPLWMGDLWLDRVDDVACVLWWGGFVAIVLANLAEFRTTAASALAARYTPLAAAVVLLFLLPFRVGAASMLNVRVATFVSLLAVATLPKLRGRASRVALAAAALATVIQAGDAFANVRHLRDGAGEDAERVLADLPRDARLLTLSFDDEPDTAVFPPWLHVAAWHVVEGGRVAGPSFADLPHWSVRYRDGQAPPDRPLFWHPCLFRNAVEGTYYDAVLVVGNVDPFASRPPGPAFHLTKHVGRFRLFRRDGGDAWPNDREDPGPCSAASAP